MPQRAAEIAHAGEHERHGHSVEHVEAALQLDMEVRIGGLAGEADAAEQRALPDGIAGLHGDGALAQVAEHQMAPAGDLQHDVIAEQRRRFVQFRVRALDAAARQQTIVGDAIAHGDDRAARRTAHLQVPGEPVPQRLARALAIGAAGVDPREIDGVALADAAAPEDAEAAVGEGSAAMGRAQIGARLHERFTAEGQHGQGFRDRLEGPDGYGQAPLSMVYGEAQGLEIQIRRQRLEGIEQVQALARGDHAPRHHLHGRRHAPAAHVHAGDEATVGVEGLQLQIADHHRRRAAVL